MKRTFAVTLEIPDKASIEEVRSYISDAVKCWHGSLRPPGGYDEYDDGDPLLFLESESVEVLSISEPKKRSPLLINKKINNINTQMERFDYEGAYGNAVDLYIDFIRRVAGKALPSNKALAQTIIRKVVNLKIPRR